MNATSRFAMILAVVLGLAAPTHAQVPAEPGSVVLQPVAVDGGQPVVSEGGYPEGAAWEGAAWERWWVSADYLMGWVSRTTVPPLVTTSPPGTLKAAAGVLGQPNTSILFADDRANGKTRCGGRIGLGCWFDADGALGVDAGFFILGGRTTSFSANSDGIPILARPFTNATNDKQASQLVAFPGTVSGSIAASVESNNFYSFHVDLKEIILAGAPAYRLEAILGYRFLNFDDGLTVQQTLVSQGGGGLIKGTHIQSLDSFSARNGFNGMDMGLRSVIYWQRWSLGMQAKVAAGGVRREVEISGNTTTTVPGFAPVDSVGGMLALSSNIGRRTSDDWTAVPDFAFTLGYDLTSSLRLRLGYSALGFLNVARASEQVSLNINPNLFPPADPSAAPKSPSFDLHKSDLWLHAVNFGLEYRY